ncbi:External alternative NADPH-ubiquinone oxidoreductase B1, mitochondrial [Hondaea fermentalgiana]|uniref:External alternative NADPH-ubiquinone oxidoreductase B1, mitochondrial n=1 Tax=Hondaea fermentalgiana TaxID=2315210 RepID=A0A2R5G8N4_9STRA|nr:External alternative NADPH-ubiquinone oxidoreductase B1, mitochondrial [Hondaea fermentalgiana]|eukprot:GBG27407.1 External alternative NADPH-ubiquinone oxidoreductase B1, mitochondrial [Hondaea fermentalgiana]
MTDVLFSSQGPEPELPRQGMTSRVPATPPRPRNASQHIATQRNTARLRLRVRLARRPGLAWPRHGHGHDHGMAMIVSMASIIVVRAASTPERRRGSSNAMCSRRLRACTAIDPRDVSSGTSNPRPRRSDGESPTSLQLLALSAPVLFALPCFALHCIALHGIALHCIALHCIVYSIASHRIASHRIASHRRADPAGEEASQAPFVELQNPNEDQDQDQDHNQEGQARAGGDKNMAGILAGAKALARGALRVARGDEEARRASMARRGLSAMVNQADNKLLKPVRLVSSRSLAKARPRIVIVGSGWGGYSFLSYIDKKKYDVQVISPSNHFLFTPLLPSSVVGTLEFRAIQEPVRTVRNLGAYYQAKALSVDENTRQITCKGIFSGDEFRVEYDFLVCAAGAKTNTFNTPGIADREGKEVFFLKHLHHARQIRNRILECFERAAIHLTDDAERDRLLTFVVVGGGPTSCELVGELRDFIRNDVAKWYPDLQDYISIHLVEAQSRLLGSFDESVAKIVERRFRRRNIQLHLGASVTGFDPETGITKLSDGSGIPTGMLVWSAGLEQTRFVQDGLDGVEKGPGKRIIIDDHLRVSDPDNKFDNRFFALGDCAINMETPLAPLAQVAGQQAKWLAKAFNEAPTGVGLVAPAAQVFKPDSDPFAFFSLGSMLTFGGFQGAVDFTQVGKQNEESNLGALSGFLSFAMWRSAYLLRQNSWTNRILIPMYWFKSFLLGRDISRF